MPSDVSRKSSPQMCFRNLLTIRFRIVNIINKVDAGAAAASQATYIAPFFIGSIRHADCIRDLVRRVQGNYNIYSIW